MIAKYDPLQDYLSIRYNGGQSISLTFSEVKDIIDKPLPASAYIHPEWWANQSDFTKRPQAKAWTKAGFKVKLFHQRLKSGDVIFEPIEC